MAIQDTIRQRAAEAYYGPNAVAFAGGPLITALMALFKSLLSGICPAAVALERAKNGNPRQKARARNRIFYEAGFMTDDSDEAERITEATMKVVDQTSPEEATEFAATT